MDVEQLEQPQQEQWEPGRDFFEALLLSSPSVGAAEAVALLGTCGAARSVGAAASLDALRAIAVGTDPVVPLIRDLEPVQDDDDEYGDYGRKFWLERTSALRGGVARGGTARIVLKTPASDEVIETDPLPELVALLRRCPNLLSLRLDNCCYELPDVGTLVGRELGAFAPLLEVGVNFPSRIIHRQRFLSSIASLQSCDVASIII